MNCGPRLGEGRDTLFSPVAMRQSAGGGFQR